MLKLRWWNIKHDTAQKYMRKNYCRYGIHKLIVGSVSYDGSNRRMKHIRYLTCRFCNYMFFAKKTDKDRHIKYENRTKENFSALVKQASSVKSKRLRTSVFV